MGYGFVPELTKVTRRRKIVELSRLAVSNLPQKPPFRSHSINSSGKEISNMSLNHEAFLQYVIFCNSCFGL